MTEGDGAFGWEPVCPLQLEAIQVSRNVDTGKAYLQVKVLNVSAAVVGAFKASFEVVQHDRSVERVDPELLDADVAPGRPLNLPAVALSAGDVELVRGRIDWARTPDGTWSASAAPVQAPKPQPLGLSEKALGERYEQLWAPLATAQTEPRLRRAAEDGLVAGEGWWVCPCGQPNVGRDACASCGVAHGRLSDARMQDPGALEAAADKREAEAKEVARKAKRKKRAVVAAVAAIIVAAVLVTAGVLVVSHFQQQDEKQAEYDRAVDLFEQGEYWQSAVAFTALGDFSDAEERAAEANERYRADRYDAAMEAYEQGDYRRAISRFEELLPYATGQEYSHLQEMRDKAAEALASSES